MPTQTKRAAKKRPNKKTKAPRFTAATADRHELYQLAVQNVEAEIDFVDERFKIIRGRKARSLREDFCGTGNTSCEWVRRRPDNTAVGLDIDPDPLGWGREHNIAPLTPSQRRRVTLLQRDVRTPGREGSGVDCVLAMNFSYWLFMTRPELLAYFKSVRKSLATDGVFFLDHFGGYESMREMTEQRDIDAGFTYIWDQHKYNPINGQFTCYIHFKFPDKTRMKKAFEYTWRLWTLPEIQELLTEAGFRNVTVYWEGDDGDGEGNGVFEPATQGEADAGFICYLTAEK